MKLEKILPEKHNSPLPGQHLLDIAHDDLLSLLSLTKLEEDFYQGQSWDLGFRAVFGGQVMGQALAAAQATVSDALVAHSFHSYFILPGDAALPVFYQVERVRDGRSFSTRRIKAVQKGNIIFDCMCSFQVVETGFEHQAVHMPDVPLPEEIEPDIMRFARNPNLISHGMRENFARHKPIEMRSVPVVADENGVKPPRRHVWMRLKDELAKDSPAQFTSLLYASDFYLLSTALQPHGVSPARKDMRVATVDHAIWFHRPIQFNEWLLYTSDSPNAGNARGFIRGQFFNKKGELVATANQEGLIRLKPSS